MDTFELAAADTGALLVVAAAETGALLTELFVAAAAPLGALPF